MIHQKSFIQYKLSITQSTKLIQYTSSLWLITESSIQVFANPKIHSLSVALTLGT